MASIFEQGKAKSTTETQPSAVKQGEAGIGAALLKDFFTRNPQGFANFLQSGARPVFPGGGGLVDALMQTMQSPQNFYSRTVQSGKPSSPSTFQDIGSLFTTLLLLNKLTGSDPNILTGAKGTPTAGADIWSWLKTKFGAGDTAAKAGAGASLPALGPSDQIGMTADPYASGYDTSGMSMDPSLLNAYFNDPNGMSFG